jgi:hypothetical protein
MPPCCAHVMTLLVFVQLARAVALIVVCRLLAIVDVSFAPSSLPVPHFTA